jgi:hypothetical protein
MQQHIGLGCCCNFGIPAPSIVPAPENDPSQQSAVDFGIINGIEPVGPVYLALTETCQSGTSIYEPLDVTITFDSNQTKVQNLTKQANIRTIPFEETKGTPTLYRQITSSDWKPVENQTYDGHQLTCKLGTCGVYQVFVTVPDSPFSFGEIYVFPNPSRKGDTPTLHVEVGQADRITARIYDISGDLITEFTLTSQPQVINGKSAYEQALDSSLFKSGVYVGVIIAEKGGKETIRKNFRFSILK